MIRLKQIIKEIMEADVPLPPPFNIQQHSISQFSDSFIDYIKSVENAQKVGYDKNKKLWFPHKSFEGGMPTIGYGHKIKDNNELEAYNKGISDVDASKLLSNDLLIANKRVHEYIKRTYKVDLVLTPKQSDILTDFSFNLGGLDKFPKFVDAVLRNQPEIMKREYKRYSGGKELGRNKQFFNKFLK